MITLTERFQIDHWNDVAGVVDPAYSLQQDLVFKGASVFNSFILKSALDEIFNKTPDICSYEGATDISLELWEPKENPLASLIVRIGSDRYIIAPKIPSEPIRLPSGGYK